MEDYATVVTSETTITHVARNDSFPKVGSGARGLRSFRGRGEEAGQRFIAVMVESPQTSRYGSRAVNLGGYSHVSDRI